MARTKTDPLDSVRITDPQALPEVSSDEPVEVIPQKPVAASLPRVPEPVAPVLVPKYRVLEMRRIIRYGQPIILRRGKVISEESHGPGIVEFLEKTGVKLEKIE
jgi:hypothetical protein